jgi:outer membrane biosynthesis protein TonB
MIRGRVYPLVVQLRNEGGGKAGQDDGATGRVTVHPVVPGALVTPQWQEIATDPGSEACFWITPLALGKLRDARVEFRSGNRIVGTVPLVRKPDWLVLLIGLLLTGPILPLLYLCAYSRYPKVRRGYWPWVLLALTFVLPVLLYLAKAYQWQPTFRGYADKPPAVQAGEPGPQGAGNQPAGPGAGRPDRPAPPAEGQQPPAKDEEKPAGEKPAEEKKAEADKPDNAKDQTPAKDQPKEDKLQEAKPDTAKEAPSPSSNKQDEPPTEKPEAGPLPERKSDPEPAAVNDAGLSAAFWVSLSTVALVQQPSGEAGQPRGPAPKGPGDPRAGPGRGVPPGGGPGRGGFGPGGPGRGGPGGPGGPGGFGAPPLGVPALPPPPADGGVERPKITFQGEQAIRRWLDHEMKYLENSKLADLDTRDLLICGIYQIRDPILIVYRNAYEIPRNLQYSELALFAVLLVVTAVYAALFGSVRTRRLGSVVELPVP